MFEHRQVDTAMVVTVDDNLDEVVSPRLNTYLNALIDGGVKYIVLDFDKVDYASSIGFGVLCKVNNRLVGLGGHLRIARINPAFNEVVRFAMLSDIFALYETVEEALVVE